MCRVALSLLWIIPCLYGADMPIEQACEAVLKQIFNINVDFSGE